MVYVKQFCWHIPLLCTAKNYWIWEISTSNWFYYKNTVYFEYFKHLPSPSPDDHKWMEGHVMFLELCFSVFPLSSPGIRLMSSEQKVRLADDKHSLLAINSISVLPPPFDPFPGNIRLNRAILLMTVKYISNCFVYATCVSINLKQFNLVVPNTLLLFMYSRP